jgi:UDP-N-acetylmuramoyl-tripeptide--D-alanyl-D-alanine ligase
MTEWTLDQIIAWTKASIYPAVLSLPDFCVSRISCDSRKVTSGDLFLALRGDRFDGHRFLDDAVRRGAAALMIDDLAAWRERQTMAGTTPADPVVLLVRDSLTALQDMAAGHRATLPGAVVAITGSVGKTSTRQMIGACLEQSLTVRQTSGNLNNEIGLPQTLLLAERTDQAIVLEMGMRGPGEIALLSQIARPDIAVITCIGWSHIGRLGSREAILAAKAEILEGLGPDRWLILNADDPYLVRLAGQIAGRCRLAWIGTGSAAVTAADAALCITAAGIHTDPERTCFTATCTRDGSRLWQMAAELPCPGKHHVRNALFALAVCQVLGLDRQRAVLGLAACRPVGGRQKIFSLAGVTVMDDAYNAAPESMEAALEALAVLAGPGRRKLAVLGCMLELGDFAAEAHRLVGEQAARLGFDLLLVMGPEAEDLLTGARSVRPDLPSCICADHEEIVTRLTAMLQPGDHVLIKGSRGYAMEEVIRLLTEQANGPRAKEGHV